MSNQQIMVDEPASNLADKYLDAEGVTIGSTLMLRERTEIAGSTATGIADVITTDPTSASPGLVVRDANGTVIAGILSIGNANTTLIASRLGSTLNVQFDPGHTLGIVDSINKTVNVQFDPGHTLGKVDAGLGTFNVQFDPGHTLGIVDSVNKTVNVQFDPGHTLGNIGTIGSITNTVAVYFDRGNPAVSATFSAASIEVVPTTGSRKITDDASAAQRVLIVGSQSNASLAISGTVTSNAGTGTMTVAFDPGHELGTIKGNTNTLTVFLPDTGHTLGKVDAGLGTFNVQLDPGHTLGAISTLASITNTVVVKIDPAGAVFVNGAHTASIFTVSGTTSTAGNNTLVSPSSAYNFKVFAYSVQTTGLVSIAPRFTTGASAGATELWRPMITPVATTSVPVGANMAVPPPGFFFATGTNTTLALYLDSATLVHYSVSYIKETA